MADNLPIHGGVARHMTPGQKLLQNRRQPAAPAPQQGSGNNNTITGSPSKTNSNAAGAGATSSSSPVRGHINIHDVVKDKNQQDHHDGSITMPASSRQSRPRSREQRRPRSREGDQHNKKAVGGEYTLDLAQYCSDSEGDEDEDKYVKNYRKTSAEGTIKMQSIVDAKSVGDIQSGAGLGGSALVGGRVPSIPKTLPVNMPKINMPGGGGAGGVISTVSGSGDVVSANNMGGDNHALNPEDKKRAVLEQYQQLMQQYQHELMVKAGFTSEGDGTQQSSLAPVGGFNNGNQVYKLDDAADQTAPAVDFSAFYHGYNTVAELQKAYATTGPRPGIDAYLADSAGFASNPNSTGRLNQSFNAQQRPWTMGGMGRTQINHAKGSGKGEQQASGGARDAYGGSVGSTSKGEHHHQHQMMSQTVGGKGGPSQMRIPGWRAPHSAHSKYTRRQRSHGSSSRGQHAGSFPHTAESTMTGGFNIMAHTADGFNSHHKDGSGSGKGTGKASTSFSANSTSTKGFGTKKVVAGRGSAMRMGDADGAADCNNFLDKKEESEIFFWEGTDSEHGEPEEGDPYLREFLKSRAKDKEGSAKNRTNHNDDRGKHEGANCKQTIIPLNSLASQATKIQEQRANQFIRAPTEPPMPPARVQQLIPSPRPPVKQSDDGRAYLQRQYGGKHNNNTSPNGKVRKLVQPKVDLSVVGNHNVGGNVDTGARPENDPKASDSDVARQISKDARGSKVRQSASAAMKRNLKAGNRGQQRISGKGHHDRDNYHVDAANIDAQENNVVVIDASSPSMDLISKYFPDTVSARSPSSQQKKRRKLGGTVVGSSHFNANGNNKDSAMIKDPGRVYTSADLHDQEAPDRITILDTRNITLRQSSGSPPHHQTRNGMMQLLPSRPVSRATARSRTGSPTLGMMYNYGKNNHGRQEHGMNAQMGTTTNAGMINVDDAHNPLQNATLKNIRPTAAGLGAIARRQASPALVAERMMKPVEQRTLRPGSATTLKSLQQKMASHPRQKTPGGQGLFEGRSEGSGGLGRLLQQQTPEMMLQMGLEHALTNMMKADLTQFLNPDGTLNEQFLVQAMHGILPEKLSSQEQHGNAPPGQNDIISKTRDLINEQHGGDKNTATTAGIKNDQELGLGQQEQSPAMGPPSYDVAAILGSIDSVPVFSPGGLLYSGSPQHVDAYEGEACLAPAEQEVPVSSALEDLYKQAVVDSGAAADDDIVAILVGNSGAAATNNNDHVSATNDASSSSVLTMPVEIARHMTNRVLVDNLEHVAREVEQEEEGEKKKIMISSEQGDAVKKLLPKLCGDDAPGDEDGVNILADKDPNEHDQDPDEEERESPVKLCRVTVKEGQDVVVAGDNQALLTEAEAAWWSLLSGQDILTGTQTKSNIDAAKKSANGDGVAGGIVDHAGGAQGATNSAESKQDGGVTLSSDTAVTLKKSGKDQVRNINTATEADREKLRQKRAAAQKQRALESPVPVYHSAGADNPRIFQGVLNTNNIAERMRQLLRERGALSLDSDIKTPKSPRSEILSSCSSPKGSSSPRAASASPRGGGRTVQLSSASVNKILMEKIPDLGAAAAASLEHQEMLSVAQQEVLNALQGLPVDLYLQYATEPQTFVRPKSSSSALDQLGGGRGRRGRRRILEEALLQASLRATAHNPFFRQTETLLGNSNYSGTTATATKAKDVRSQMGNSAIMGKTTTQDIEQIQMRNTHSGAFSSLIPQRQKTSVVGLLSKNDQENAAAKESDGEDKDDDKAGDKKSVDKNHVTIANTEAEGQAVQNLNQNDTQSVVTTVRDRMFAVSERMVAAGAVNCSVEEMQKILEEALLQEIEANMNPFHLTGNAGERYFAGPTHYVGTHNASSMVSKKTTGQASVPSSPRYRLGEEDVLIEDEDAARHETPSDDVALAIKATAHYINQFGRPTTSPATLQKKRQSQRAFSAESARPESARPESARNKSSTTPCPVFGSSVNDPLRHANMVNNFHKTEITGLYESYIDYHLLAQKAQAQSQKQRPQSAGHSGSAYRGAGGFRPASAVATSHGAGTGHGIVRPSTAVATATSVNTLETRRDQDKVPLDMKTLVGEFEKAGLIFPPEFQSLNTFSGKNKLIASGLAQIIRNTIEVVGRGGRKNLEDGCDGGGRNPADDSSVKNKMAGTTSTSTANNKTCFDLEELRQKFGTLLHEGAIESIKQKLLKSRDLQGRDQGKAPDKREQEDRAPDEPTTIKRLQLHDIEHLDKIIARHNNPEAYADEIRAEQEALRPQRVPSKVIHVTMPGTTVMKAATKEKVAAVTTKEKVAAKVEAAPTTLGRRHSGDDGSSKVVATAETKSGNDVQVDENKFFNNIEVREKEAAGAAAAELCSAKNNNKPDSEPTPEGLPVFDDSETAIISTITANITGSATTVIDRNGSHSRIATVDEHERNIKEALSARMQSSVQASGARAGASGATASGNNINKRATTPGSTSAQHQQKQRESANNRSNANNNINSLVSMSRSTPLTAGSQRNRNSSQIAVTKTLSADSTTTTKGTTRAASLDKKQPPGPDKKASAGLQCGDREADKDLNKNSNQSPSVLGAVNEDNKASSEAVLPTGEAKKDASEESDVPARQLRSYAKKQVQNSKMKPCYSSSTTPGYTVVYLGEDHGETMVGAFTTTKTWRDAEVDRLTEKRRAEMMEVTVTAKEAEVAVRGAMPNNYAQPTLLTHEFPPDVVDARMMMHTNGFCARPLIRQTSRGRADQIHQGGGVEESPQQSGAKNILVLNDLSLHVTPLGNHFVEHEAGPTVASNMVHQNKNRGVPVLSPDIALDAEVFGINREQLNPVRLQQASDKRSVSPSHPVALTTPRMGSSSTTPSRLAHCIRGHDLVIRRPSSTIGTDGLMSAATRAEQEHERSGRLNPAGSSKIMARPRLGTSRSLSPRNNQIHASRGTNLSSVTPTTMGANHLRSLSANLAHRGRAPVETGPGGIVSSTANLQDPVLISSKMMGREPYVFFSGHAVLTRSRVSSRPATADNTTAMSMKFNNHHHASGTLARTMLDPVEFLRDADDGAQSPLLKNTTVRDDGRLVFHDSSPGNKEEEEDTTIRSTNPNRPRGVQELEAFIIEHKNRPVSADTMRRRRDNAKMRSTNYRTFQARGRMMKSTTTMLKATANTSPPSMISKGNGKGEQVAVMSGVPKGADGVHEFAGGFCYFDHERGDYVYLYHNCGGVAGYHVQGQGGPEKGTGSAGAHVEDKSDPAAALFDPRQAPNYEGWRTVDVVETNFGEQAAKEQELAEKADQPSSALVLLPVETANNEHLETTQQQPLLVIGEIDPNLPWYHQKMLEQLQLKQQQEQREREQMRAEIAAVEVQEEEPLRSPSPPRPSNSLPPRSSSSSPRGKSGDKDSAADVMSEQQGGDDLLLMDQEQSSSGVLMVQEQSGSAVLLEQREGVLIDDDLLWTCNRGCAVTPGSARGSRKTAILITHDGTLVKDQPGTIVGGSKSFGGSATAGNRKGAPVSSASGTKFTRMSALKQIGITYENSATASSKKK